MTELAGPDLVSVLEAAYTVDAPEHVWLKSIVDAVRPAIQDGLGIAAYLYDTAERPFKLRSFIVEDCPIDEEGLASLQNPANDDFVRSTWIGRAAMTASETPGFATHPGVTEVFHPAGIRDVMVVNAIDPIGVGCWIGAPLRKLRTLSADERERWNRVATHVRSSLRLRLRLAARAATGTKGLGDAEAVLDRDGNALHLEGEAERARETLREAVLGIQRARTELRREPDRALPSWKALIRARWTLVEDFQANGSFYIVARSNSLDTNATARLSWRERQVVACLSMGQTNKEIAYELGLSHSTVRVLVARACAKLGAPTREHLVSMYRRDELAQNA